jgi:hypothetical protein
MSAEEFERRLDPDSLKRVKLHGPQKPEGWDGFLESVKDLDVPDDFLSPEERHQDSPKLTARGEPSWLNQPQFQDEGTYPFEDSPEMRAVKEEVQAELGEYLKLHPEELTWDWQNVPPSPTLKDLFRCAAASLHLDPRTTLDWLIEAHPKFGDQPPILFEDKAEAIKIIHRIAYGFNGPTFSANTL